MKQIIQLFILFFTVPFIFSGCSQSAHKYFDKEPNFMKNFQHTKVVKIIKNKEVKAIANITYLNNADSEKWDNGKQNFLVGIYGTNNDTGHYTLERVLYEIDEAGVRKEIILMPVESKEVLKNDPLYKNIPFRNNWAQYKVISYENMEDEAIFLFIIKGDEIQSRIVKFIKN
jgi:hypothetical protein